MVSEWHVAGRRGKLELKGKHTHTYTRRNKQTEETRDEHKHRIMTIWVALHGYLYAIEC